MVHGKRVTKAQAGRQTAGAGASGTAKKRGEKSMCSMCSGCKKVVAEDTRAVQCDRCLSSDAWRCAECLNLTEEAYDILLESGKCLQWFCDGCLKVVMSPEVPMSDCGSKLDKMIRLLEQLVEKTASLEQKLNEKADQKSVCELESRIVKLEVAGTSKEAKATTVQAVEEVFRKQCEEDSDISSRRCNIIVYRCQEEEEETVEERKQKDRSFVMELCNKELGVDVNDHDIGKMYRLGKKTQDGKSRPLLVGFKIESKKLEIMNNLTRLKEADQRFRTVGIAHDLSPRQREEVRKALEAARRQQEESGQPAGNQKFRVVGQGSKLRVVKVSGNQ